MNIKQYLWLQKSSAIAISDEDAETQLIQVEQAATGKTAMEFQDHKREREDKARAYINNVLENIGVEGRGTYIEKIDLLEHLDKFRQDGAEAELERDLVQKQQLKVSSSQAGTPIQPLSITNWAQTDESY